MKNIILAMMVAVGILPVFAQAQDTLLQDLPNSWTLENSIAYAKKYNISVTNLRLSARSSQEDLLQARAAKLPTLTGSLSTSVVNSTNADPVVGGFTTQASFTNNYSVNSQITLFNGGYIKNDVKAKELSVQAANLSVKETENSVTLSITQAFLNILLARENIIYLQDVLNTSREQLKQSQQRYDAGSLSKKDFLQFQAQVATDEYNLVNAQNTLKNNTLTLKQILQLPTTYDFQVTVPESVTQLPSIQNLADAQDAAQKSRPEVQYAQTNVALAKVNLHKIKADALPSITMSGALSTGYSDNQTNPYLKQLNSNFYQSLGISVNIPIYNRRINKTNINKYNILIDQAKLSLLDTKNTLNQEVEQVYNNWQNANAQFTAASTLLRTSEESYNITNEQLKLGSVNLVELLQQKNSYVSATQSYVQARYSAILYSKIFDFYAGLPITL